jgi:hypothetical protein
VVISAVASLFRGTFFHLAAFRRAHGSVWAKRRLFAFLFRNNAENYAGMDAAPSVGDDDLDF